MPFSIVLGKPIREKTDCFLIDMIGSANSFGFGVFAATSGYGKTELLKNIMVQQFYCRKGRIVIFDIYDDYKNINIPNFEQKDQIFIRIPSMKTIEIKNAGIYLEDMSAVDWQGLGFMPKTTAQLMQIINENPGMHIEELLDLIEELPTDKREMDSYSGSVPLRAPINKAIKTAMLSNLSHCRQMFISKESGKLRLTEALFKELLLAQTAIRIKFDASDITIKTKTLVGIILRLCSRLLWLKPVFYCDESDKLFPRISEADNKPIPSSVYWAIEYVRKIGRRNNIMMYFLIQDFGALHSAIIENSHFFIIGAGVAGISKLSGVLPNYMLNGINYLHWDSARNYREFLFAHKGGQGYQIFTPQDSLTLPKNPFWQNL